MVELVEIECRIHSKSRTTELIEALPLGVYQQKLFTTDELFTTLCKSMQIWRSLKVLLTCRDKVIRREKTERTPVIIKTAQELTVEDPEMSLHKLSTILWVSYVAICWIPENDLR